jgi:hypothetical protein
VSSNQQLLLGEGAGGGLPNFIEEVFSTYLYTGNSSTQTITNNIDLSTKGGLVWLKARSAAANHGLVDTVRGFRSYLSSDSTAAAYTNVLGYDVTAFNANGFSLGPSQAVSTNTSGINYVSWTFREQPKFFDVVTYTGTGATQTVAHNLGSAPGMVIVKVTSTANDWWVWHRGLSAGNYIKLNLTDAQSTTNAQFFFGNGTTTVDPSSTVITLGGSGAVNGNGVSYVAYLFAHNAGGFGLAGTDNVISCGSYTGNGSSTGPTVTLGYEPQWIMVKRTDSTGSWLMLDIMRGIPNTPGVAAGSAYLFAESANAEDSAFAPFAALSATGFSLLTSNAQINDSAGTYIYIAIRRGPMKVPTVGTSVFSPQAFNSPANGTQVTTGFPIDLSMFKARDGGPSGQFQDRLRGLPSTAGGGTPALYPDATAAESTNQTGYEFWNTGYRTYTAQNAVWWMFRRAPGFFDEVCYTGTGTSGRAIPHNLAAVPELIICKQRSSGGTRNWIVYAQPLGSSKYLYLNDTLAAPTLTNVWGTQTSTTFGVENFAEENDSGQSFVAYLFATCAGVSKVGSYTGNGSSQTIACGFTAGSRFVMIKRTDSTGDWYVWDSARGIVAGNDPHLSLNTTAAEVTTDDSVDTDNSGFIVNQVAATNVNVTSATYIFLAIA